MTIEEMMALREALLTDRYRGIRAVELGDMGVYATVVCRVCTHHFTRARVESRV